MAFIKFFPPDLGVDLGTSRTIISKKDGTILINEPSVVAVDMSSYEIIAVGKEAKDMLGKTPENILVVRPMENGVIADFETAQGMMTYFIRNAIKGFTLFQPRLCITVPVSLTDVERRSVEDMGLHAGAREVRLIEENVASGMGIGLDVFEAQGHLIVNVGAGTIEVSAISVGGVVASSSLSDAGETIDTGIQYLLKKNENLIIGLRMAEEVKRKVATFISGEEKTIVVTGRDLVTGMPKTIEIKSSDIMDVVYPIAEKTVNAIRAVLEKLPPDLSSDIAQEGIYFLGGLSLIPGFAEYITKNINIDILQIEEARESTGKGIGLMISEVYKKKSRIRK